MRLWKQNILIIIILILLVLCAVKISHASGEGSITIVGTTSLTASTIRTTFISDIAPNTNYSYSAGGIFYIGKNYDGAVSRLYHAISILPTLRDSIRTLGSSRQIDSCFLYYVVNAAGTAGDSVFTTPYEIVRQTFVFGNGLATDTCGVTWDSAYMTGDGSCSGTPAAWGTAGCLNSSTDHKATGEGDSVLLTAGPADNGDTVRFPLSAANVADTNNYLSIGYAVVFLPNAYGGNDGVSSRWTLSRSTTAQLPFAKIWYSDKPVVGGTSYRRRIVLGRPQ